MPCGLPDAHPGACCALRCSESACNNVSVPAKVSANRPRLAGGRACQQLLPTARPCCAWRWDAGTLSQARHAAQLGYLPLQLPTRRGISKMSTLVGFGRFAPVLKQRPCQHGLHAWAGGLGCAAPHWGCIGIDSETASRGCTRRAAPVSWTARGGGEGGRAGVAVAKRLPAVVLQRGSDEGRRYRQAQLMCLHP